MRGQSKAIVTTSWDDGHPLDVKLADLLRKFEIKGTFYIAPRNREREVISISDLKELSKEFEIGAHTLTHPELHKLSRQELEFEINGSKSELENLLALPVRTFSYPKGKYNHRVKLAVISAGFEVARTTREFVLDLGPDPWEMPTSLLASPVPCWLRLRHLLVMGNYQGMSRFMQHGLRKNWAEIALRLFKETLEHGGIWHLWGHSWRIDEVSIWEDLRALFDRISKRDEVCYLTNSQVLEEVRPISSTPMNP